MYEYLLIEILYKKKVELYNWAFSLKIFILKYKIIFFIMLLESRFLFSKSVKIVCQFSHAIQEWDHQKTTGHFQIIIIGWSDGEIVEGEKVEVAAELL
jgi:hypothetical protein